MGDCVLTNRKILVCDMIKGTEPADHVGLFGFHGYMILLMGQQVPTAAPPPSSPRDLQAWNYLRELFRAEADKAPSVREALMEMFKAP